MTENKNNTNLSQHQPITIYVIYHKTFDDQNVFTTDCNKIQPIIEQKTIDLLSSGITDAKADDWSYRQLIEEQPFGADMGCF
jgi:hypothetical protein